jgi:hypothetical protein
MAMNRLCACMALLVVSIACRAESRADSVTDTNAVVTRGATALDVSDGCRQTNGQRPDASIASGSDQVAAWRRAFARGAEYHCLIDTSLALRIVLAGDTTVPSLDSIHVLTAADGQPLQSLSLGTEVDMPMPYTLDVLRTIDLDADGHRDLLLGTSWGATGNTAYAVWRFDPATRQFRIDSTLSTLSNPRPVPGQACVTTSYNSSAVDDAVGLYCLHAGAWKLDSLESNRWDREARSVVHEIVARRGDSLTLLSRTTRPDSM